MSLAALIALRNRLSNDTELTAYWTAQYNKPATHLIGYKKAPSANDFPSLCYVPVQSLSKLNRPGDTAVSLVVGVNEPGITDGVFDGIARLDEAVILILGALLPLRLNDDYVLGKEDVKIIHDLGSRHPFHELEMQLSIIRR